MSRLNVGATFYNYLKQLLSVEYLPQRLQLENQKSVFKRSHLTKLSKSELGLT